MNIKLNIEIGKTYADTIIANLGYKFKVVADRSWKVTRGKEKYLGVDLGNGWMKIRKWGK